jgi:phage head maturation protease
MPWLASILEGNTMSNFYEPNRVLIHGVACFWNSATDDGREKPFSIEREAFEFVDLTNPDIKLTIDHETELATVGDGCLSIRINDTGLFYTANLPRCSGSLELKRKIDSGFFSGSSVEVFGVAVPKTMGGKRGQHFRHVDALADVAIVTRPGNSRCFVSAHEIRQTLNPKRPTAHRKPQRNQALRARMRGTEMKLRAQTAVHSRVANAQGLTLGELYSRAANGPAELCGCLLYSPDGQGGWRYLGR